jgi:hypothetical protein
VSGSAREERTDVVQLLPGHAFGEHTVECRR